MTETKLKDILNALARETSPANIEASEGISSADILRIAEKYACGICRRKEELSKRRSTRAPDPAFGIDVSAWQGTVSWNRVKNNQNGGFAMLRAACGQEEDSRFESNYREAKSAGIPVGAYLYSMALDEAEAEAEAEFMLSLIKDKELDYPLAFDIEESAQVQLGAEKCSAIIYAFCNKLEQAGYYVCFYSYEDFLLNYVTEDVRSKYDLWIADVGGTPTLSGGMRQYSFSGSVPGINGRVDLDEAYKDYPSIIADMKKRRSKA